MPLVLTLATPHQRPPGPLQPSLAAFYRRLAAARVPAVPVVSVAGGRHDMQVNLCLLNSFTHGMAARRRDAPHSHMLLKEGSKRSCVRTH